MTDFELIEQLCKDLNEAHGELMRVQGLDPAAFDWPTWTSPANSIRAAELRLDKRLAKSTNVSMFPDREYLAGPPDEQPLPTHDDDEHCRLCGAPAHGIITCQAAETFAGFFTSIMNNQPRKGF